METQVETHYVYLLQAREFLNLNVPVYKIGRSKRVNLLRFEEYPRGSVLLFQSSCYDSLKLENEIIALFKRKYILKLGNEWFQGDSDKMVQDFCDIIKNERETPVKAPKPMDAVNNVKAPKPMDAVNNVKAPKPKHHNVKAPK